MSKPHDDKTRKTKLSFERGSVVHEEIMIIFSKSASALMILLAATGVQAASLESISVKDASAGVKEALVKGAEYAVSSLGKENGFLGNDKVKIPLPESLKKIEKTMQTLGMGKHTDELVATMNHAAEAAVAESKPILMDSIKKMSINDAKGILAGGEGSVTNYFKHSSSDALTRKFMPIVKNATKKVKLAEQYNKFAGKAANLGMIDKKDADLDGYVTQKAMDGLFAMIAEKEKSLRANPLEAGTALLKKIFGAI